MDQSDKLEDLDDILSKGGMRSFRVFSNKQKDLNSNINNNVDKFISDYNNFLFENFLFQSIDKYENIFNEKINKKIEIEENFSDQIAEMELLLRNSILLFN